MNQADAIAMKQSPTIRGARLRLPLALRARAKFRHSASPTLELESRGLVFLSAVPLGLVAHVDRTRLAVWNRHFHLSRSSVMRSDKTSNDRAPLCAICGHRHWTREPHNFKKPKPPVKAKRK